MTEDVRSLNFLILEQLYNHGILNFNIALRNDRVSLKIYEGDKGLEYVFDANDYSIKADPIFDVVSCINQMVYQIRVKNEKS